MQPLKYSAQSLVAFQSKFATKLNPIEVWPKSFYDTLYCKNAWPGLTFHNFRDPEHIKQVLVDQADAFEKAPLNQALLEPIFGEGLLTSHGQRWALQRAAAAPAFKRAAIQALAQRMTSAAAHISDKLDEHAGASPVEVLPFMAEATFHVIASLLFGAMDSPEPYPEMAIRLTAYLDGAATPDAPEVQVAIDWLKAYASSAVEQQLAAKDPNPSLLSILLTAVERELDLSLSMKEVSDNIVTFILAGHETTGVALTWALFCLAKAPSVQEQVLAEVRDVCGDEPVRLEHVPKLGLIHRVIQETLRLYPPIASLSRLALRDVDIGDVSVSAGDVADILIYPMHRNRQIWAEPAHFDPDRFLEDRISQRHKFAFLPFGAGPRICIGSQMAYMEQAVFLATFIRRFVFAPAPGYVEKPRMRVSLRPHDGMPLVLSRR